VGLSKWRFLTTVSVGHRFITAPNYEQARSCKAGYCSCASSPPTFQFARGPRAIFTRPRLMPASASATIWELAPPMVPASKRSCTWICRKKIREWFDLEVYSVSWPSKTIRRSDEPPAMTCREVLASRLWTWEK
jgi:hypothetical protein